MKIANVFCCSLYYSLLKLTNLESKSISRYCSHMSHFSTENTSIANTTISLKVSFE
jgi:hypothetical protein